MLILVSLNLVRKLLKVIFKALPGSSLLDLLKRVASKTQVYSVVVSHLTPPVLLLLSSPGEMIWHIDMVCKL